MALMAINYDLFKEPSREYRKLFAAIQGFPTWCHALESLWFVVTNRTPKEVFDILRPHLHLKDKVLVTPVQLNAGWWAQGLPDEVMQWLYKHLTTQIGVQRN
jgi:hypothetical protein